MIFYENEMKSRQIFAHQIVLLIINGEVSFKTVIKARLSIVASTCICDKINPNWTDNGIVVRYF